MKYTKPYPSLRYWSSLPYGLNSTHKSITLQRTLKPFCTSFGPNDRNKLQGRTGEFLANHEISDLESEIAASSAREPCMSGKRSATEGRDNKRAPRPQMQQLYTPTVTGALPMYAHEFGDEFCIKVHKLVSSRHTHVNIIKGTIIFYALSFLPCHRKKEETVKNNVCDLDIILEYNEKFYMIALG